MANELILATNTVLNLHSGIVYLCLTPVSESAFFFFFISRSFNSKMLFEWNF